MIESAIISSTNKKYVRYSQKEKEEAIVLLRSGKAVIEISRTLNIKSRTLYCWAKKLKIRPLSHKTKKASKKVKLPNKKKGFKRLLVVPDPIPSSNDRVEITSPKGFRLFIPISQNKLLIQFFQGGVL